MAIAKAYWKLLSKVPALPRSSHCLVATPSGKVLLYGGELRPREPVDADDASKGVVRLYDARSALLATKPTDWVTQKPAGDNVPVPRVGAATTILGDNMYLFGGRGGVDMAPIAGEQAGLWRYSIGAEGATAHWERLPAADEGDAPQPRSYHSMASYGVSKCVYSQCNCN